MRCAGLARLPLPSVDWFGYANSLLFFWDGTGVLEDPFFGPQYPNVTQCIPVSPCLSDLRNPAISDVLDYEKD